MKDEDVGYKRPPKSTRWKKGQSGNPNRVRRRQPKKVYKIIEEVLATEIDLVENSVRRRVTILEAILMQLWKQAVGGSKRALRVLHRYEALAKTMPDTYVKSPEDARIAAEKYKRLINALE